MINQNFVLVGVIIQFFAGIGYAVDTFKGKVKPNRVSWFLWILAPMIAFFAEIKQGVGIQSLLTFIIGFVPLMVLLASFTNKKSYWKIGKIDLICGAFSLLGLILWLITKTGNIAIFFSVIADGLASVPTIIKSFQEPESEGSLVFWAGIPLGIITLLTIKQWTFAEYAFPIYLTLNDFLIASLISFKLGKFIMKSSKHLG